MHGNPQLSLIQLSINWRWHKARESSQNIRASIAGIKTGRRVLYAYDHNMCALRQTREQSRERGKQRCFARKTKNNTTFGTHALVHDQRIAKPIQNYLLGKKQSKRAKSARGIIDHRRSGSQKLQEKLLLCAFFSTQRALSVAPLRCLDFDG